MVANWLEISEPWVGYHIKSITYSLRQSELLRPSSSGIKQTASQPVRQTHTMHRVRKEGRMRRMKCDMFISTYSVGSAHCTTLLVPILITTLSKYADVFTNKFTAAILFLARFVRRPKVCCVSCGPLWAYIPLPTHSCYDTCSPPTCACQWVPDGFDISKRGSG
jgi:hypothetical protein